MLYYRMKLLQDKIRFLCYFIEYLCALALAPFFRKRKEYRNLWIISERGVDARDNGYHLFKYIRTYQPQINVCYIISKKSKDIHRVRKLGRIIEYRSFKHVLAYVLSEVKISTHIMGFSPDLYFFKLLDAKWKVYGKKVFLQHGIIIHNTSYLHADGNHLDLFICGARKEYQFVRESFGYDKDVVQLLGLCRYDALESKKMPTRKRIILLMPTWRMYLQRLSENAFLKSDYYKSYQSLLVNQRLDNLLEKYDYQLIFYPHHEIQPYLKCFVSKCNRILLFDESNADIQRCLVDADILITDYSSVLFDFAYMNKPAFYYQFDKQDFYKAHYKSAYFSFEKDGFGDVCDEEKGLIDAIEKCVETGAEMKMLYRERVSQFFELHDHNNCKRNFQAIYDLISKEN